MSTIKTDDYLITRKYLLMDSYQYADVSPLLVFGSMREIYRLHGIRQRGMLSFLAGWVLILLSIRPMVLHQNSFMWLFGGGIFLVIIGARLHSWWCRTVVAPELGVRVPDPLYDEDGLERTPNLPGGFWRKTMRVSGIGVACFSCIAGIGTMATVPYATLAQEGWHSPLITSFLGFTLGSVLFFVSEIRWTRHG